MSNYLYGQILVVWWKFCVRHELNSILPLYSLAFNFISLIYIFGHNISIPNYLYLTVQLPCYYENIDILKNLEFSMKCFESLHALYL